MNESISDGNTAYEIIVCVLTFALFELLENLTELSKFCLVVYQQEA